MSQLVVDGHEDIAFNALMLHRDFLLDISKLRASDTAPEKEGTPTVCLPELIKGNVRIAFGTIWVAPCGNPVVDATPCYTNSEEAHEQGLMQLEYYRNLERKGHLVIIENQAQLQEHLDSRNEGKLGLVILMEGADPIREPKEAADWFKKGVRIVGPAWSKTKYCGGTGAPGPLTSEGRELMKEMEALGFVLDISHFAEQSFFESLQHFHGTVIASHANCRSFTPTDRHLSDEMIQAIVSRGGVIGTTFYNGFLDPEWPNRGKVKSEVTFDTVVKHMQHVCALAGDKLHSAVGSDLDGGFGLESTPRELNTVADLQKLAGALKRAGFSETEVSLILGGNWLRILEKSLPR